MDADKEVAKFEYGVAFRMEDYYRKLEQGKRASDEKNAIIQTQTTPAPIKTARRQQAAHVEGTKQNTHIVDNGLLSQNPYTGITQKSDPIGLSLEMSAKGIRETKLTASEMSELVRRRLPASELYKIENPTAKTLTLNRDIQVVTQEPMPIMHSELNKLTNNTLDSTKKPKTSVSINWQAANCVCCAICGCSFCTAILGVCIALCYEWFG